MDYAALPPEVNSGRMYAGAGSGPMWAAAAAWDGVAAELSSATASYRSVLTALTRGPWLGPAAAAMAAAAATYATWLGTTAEQVKQAARQAKSAAAAYEEAFAATVPPPVIAENRARLMSLLATNLFGQNTPAIAVTETHYSEMWAQDATAMYSYASESAAAARLTPFNGPPQDTDPAGVSEQTVAVNKAVTTSVGSKVNPTAMQQLISTTPSLLQTLSGASGDPTLSDIFNVTASGTYVASGVLFILGPLMTGPINAVLPPTILGMAAPALGAAGAAALMSDTTPGLGSAASSIARPGVLAGLGRSGTLGGLSVPQTWAEAAPVISRAATAVPAPALVGFPEAEVDPMGPGYGGILPGSLMAAAAGGGGAAGGGFAATRAAGAQRSGATAGAGGTAPSDERIRARYRPPPSVLPQVASAAGPRASAGGDGWSSESLHDEIKDLRKQVNELALEREVLMRSLALWARGTLDE